MAKGSDVLDERRVASATVRGYEYQVLRAALIWLDLEDGETLLCEGDEDIDRILRDGTRLSEQDKHYQGTLRLKDRAVADSLIAFAKTWVARLDGKGSSRFRFVTTADRQKSLDEVGWRAMVRRELPALVRKREAGLAQQVEDRGGWDVFCSSVEWCFGDGNVEQKRGELVAAVGRRVPGSPSTLFAARLVAQLFAVIGQDESTLRVRTRADLDVLAAVTDEELRSWVSTGAGSAIAERFELAGLLDDGLRPLPPQKRNPSSLLVAGARVVEFNREIRAVEWRMFEELLACDEPVLIRLLYGEGGSGKTRFAIEAVQEARQRGWIAGFLRARPDDDSWRRLREGRLPRLVVLDYAESRDEELKRLLGLADMIRKDGGPPLRLLLLAREKAEWWTSLEERGESLFQNLLLSSAVSQRITSITLDDGQREVLFARACEQLAAQIEGVDPARARRPSLASAAFDRPLYVVSAAYAALHGDIVEDGVAVLSWILNHEALFWRKGLEARGWKVRRAEDWTIAEEGRVGEVAGAVAAFTLLGGVSGRDDADAVVRSAILDIGSEDRDSVTGLLCDVYGGDGSSQIVAPLEPDLLGERLVEIVLAVDDPLLERLREEILKSDARMARSLEVLGRIGVRKRQARLWIEAVLALDLARTAGVAIRIAPTLGAHSASAPVGDCLAAVLERSGTASLQKEGLEQLERQFPEASVSLARAAGWVAEMLLADSNITRDPYRRAHRLSVFALHASALGRREAAKTAAEEATAKYRALAAVDYDAFLPDLAMSLNNLGNMLSAVGQFEAAKIAAEEATAKYRALAAVNPDAFLPDLAMSLNNLGNRLSELGQREEARTAAEEATAKYRALAAVNPDAFLPNLAGSLNNLGNMLSELGHREAAKTATEEATAKYRALAAVNPNAFLPNLARSLGTLASILTSDGAHEHATELLAEALTSIRDHVVASPAAFSPLARAIVARYLQSVEAANLASQPELILPIIQAIGEPNEPT